MISCLDQVGHHVTYSASSTSFNTNKKNRQMIVCKDFWNEITITVASNTRGRFHLPVTRYTKIPLIKKIISELIQVPEQQILLLHNERYVSQGTLRENSISGGCILTFFVLADTGPLLSPNTKKEKEQIQNILNNHQEAKKIRRKSASAKNFWIYLKTMLRYLSARFLP